MNRLRNGWPLFLPETPAPWRPLADIYRTRGGWLLKFALAGVRLDDVTVSVEGCRVSVSGCRRDVLEQGASYHSMEIPYNRFERTVEMPLSLEGATISLEARDGFLLVRMSTEGNYNVR